MTVYPPTPSLDQARQVDRAPLGRAPLSRAPLSRAPLSRAPLPRLLTFELGGKVRGLAAERVARVAEIHHFTPLPSDLPSNLGLVNHRGVVAGLVDLELLETQEMQAQLGATAAAERVTTLRRAALQRLQQPPFLCIFARFHRGVAGFAIDRLLALRQGAAQTHSDDANVRQPPAPGVELIKIDRLGPLA